MEPILYYFLFFFFFKKRNSRKTAKNFSNEHNLDTNPTLALSVHPFRDQNISITDEMLPRRIVSKQTELFITFLTEGNKFRQQKKYRLQKLGRTSKS